MSGTSLHPFIDGGLLRGDKGGDPNKSGGKLYCHCNTNAVCITLTSQVMHNHACGCSKCWKPSKAVFAVVGVVPRDNVEVTENGNKLKVIDSSAAIQRTACKECGVHMFGRIEKEHPFKGLDFVHVELSPDKGWQEPQFAAFVSSILEQGFDPDRMGDVRKKLQAVGLPTYDCLSPELMDLISIATAKQAGTFKAKF